jgi:hypothetical protein
MSAHSDVGKYWTVHEDPLECHFAFRAEVAHVGKNEAQILLYFLQVLLFVM